MFTDSFSYTAQPMRVVFGQGLPPLREQVWELGVSRAVVISTTMVAALIADKRRPRTADLTSAPIEAVDDGERSSELRDTTPL